jgi:hypothetical protein
MGLEFGQVARPEPRLLSQLPFCRAKGVPGRLLPLPPACTGEIQTDFPQRSRPNGRVVRPEVFQRACAARSARASGRLRAGGTPGGTPNGVRSVFPNARLAGCRSRAPRIGSRPCESARPGPAKARSRSVDDAATHPASRANGPVCGTTPVPIKRVGRQRRNRSQNQRGSPGVMLGLPSFASRLPADSLDKWYTGSQPALFNCITHLEVERPMPDRRFWHDASGRLIFGMSRTPADRYQAICHAIAATFHLSPHNALVSNGWDIVFQDYKCDEQIVSLEWDNWTGFIVVAKTPGSEVLVQNIAAWLLQSHWVSPSNPARPGTAPDRGSV